MNIKDLQYVLAISEVQSFSKAAELLFVSQPALSQHLKRVEHNLGVNLFNRNKSRVVLTPAGEEFVKHARIIIEQVQALEFKVRHFEQNKKDTLTFGVSQFYGRHLLSTLIFSFEEILKGYQVKIIEGESRYLESLITQKKLDFGIFPAPIYTKGIISKTLYQEHIMFAFSKNNKEATKILSNAYNGQTINLGFYKNFPFVLLKEGLKLRNLSKRLCKEAIFYPHAVFETENLDTVYSMIKKNYGVGFLPSTMLQNIADKDVLFFKLPSRMATRDLVIAYREDCFENKLVDKLVNAAKNCINPH